MPGSGWDEAGTRLVHVDGSQRVGAAAVDRQPSSDPPMGHTTSGPPGSKRDRMRQRPRAAGHPVGCLRPAARAQNTKKQSSSMPHCCSSISKNARPLTFSPLLRLLLWRPVGRFQCSTCDKLRQRPFCDGRRPTRLELFPIPIIGSMARGTQWLDCSMLFHGAAH